jgi:hypothetical protein
MSSLAPGSRKRPLKFKVPISRIRELADTWDREGMGGNELYQSLDQLAALFWSRYMNRVQRRQWDRDLRRNWHHLLLAVANFKRQQSSRIIPFPALQTAESLSKQLVRADRIHIPELGQISRVPLLEELETFTERLIGVGVPTGSLLLAVLWPDDHLMMDRRVLHVATVIDEAGSQHLRRKHMTELRTQRDLLPAWEDYLWFRSRAMATRATARKPLPLYSIERAFYTLDRMVGRQPGRTWETYQLQIQSRVRSSRPLTTC